MSLSPELTAIDTSEEPDDEPLGSQHFLYDVNIEYSPGGSRQSSLAGNRHSFKLRCLPYMVLKGCDEGLFYKNSVASSESSICDDDSILNSEPKHVVDVTKATCAFLGNSDYVPNNNYSNRRVVLELISAKLSQSTTTFNVPANTSLGSLIEHSSPRNNGISPTLRQNNTYSSPIRHHDTNNSTPTHSPSPSSPLSSSSSKRFVNYTLLIKTTPGLDKRPAVIERRFSDFLLLYQGLKSNESCSKIVDKYVTFPKKVYMGNFSLTNIAERSIEFTRLLNLCMTSTNLLWSDPFISFLLDKELKEAHRLALCGDPDDVQVLIETAYHIEQKLYLNIARSRNNNNNNNSNSSISLDSYTGTITSGQYLPSSPSGGPQIVNSPSIESNSDQNRPLSTNPSSSPDMSVCGISQELDSASQTKDGFNSMTLNQRLLVTFCILFLTYYRGERYPELKLAVQEFSQLISSQEYLDSMVNTRHHMTLRACLLFLMNINQGNIIDDDRRLWLKRKLEEIDGSIADLRDSTSNHSFMDNDNSSFSQSPKNKRCNGEQMNGTSIYRVTNGDLTSLLRDRNFCSFQDSIKFIR